MPRASDEHIEAIVEKYMYNDIVKEKQEKLLQKNNNKG